MVLTLYFKACNPHGTSEEDSILTFYTTSLYAVAWGRISFPFNAQERSNIQFPNPDVKQHTLNMLIMYPTIRDGATESDTPSVPLPPQCDFVFGRLEGGGGRWGDEGMLNLPCSLPPATDTSLILHE